MGHELVHFFNGIVPNGSYYFPENNVCLINNSGIVSLVYIGDTNINWQDTLSIELLSILYDIKNSPMNVSSYTPDPNSEVAKRLQKISDGMDDPLKRLVPLGSFQPSLPDLASVIEQIMRAIGLPELVDVDRLLSSTIHPGSEVSGHQSPLSPIEACQSP